MSTQKTERPECSEARRIVVKVGSGVLTRDGAVNSRIFSEIARQVSALRDQEREVIVVSSGAIAIGARDLGWDTPG
ncbi:MAG: hypothetical protein QF391_07150, partial [Myxococcota bacterium]|nr:hypothetical protein [Myxococcota bacterium]